MACRALPVLGERATGCMQVRSMRESRGDVTEAGPSIAVQMVGLNTVPVAGDEFCVCTSEQEVRPSPNTRAPSPCL